VLPSVTALGGFLIGALAGGRVGSRWSGRPRAWLAAAFGFESAVIAVVAVLFGTGVGVGAGDGRYIAIAVLACALGIQNSTVRHLGAPDLTTTVLTLTLTGLAADSFLAGGPGARPHRRLGSVALMLAGAALGAGLLEVSVTSVIAVAASVVALVALGFALGKPPGKGTEHSAGPSQAGPGTGS